MQHMYVSGTVCLLQESVLSVHSETEGVLMHQSLHVNQWVCVLWWVFGKDLADHAKTLFFCQCLLSAPPAKTHRHMQLCSCLTLAQTQMEATRFECLNLLQYILICSYFYALFAFLTDVSCIERVENKCLDVKRLKKDRRNLRLRTLK